MIRRLLFTILVCLISAANTHGQIDYYLPPCSKVVLDTNVWTYNTYNPSFFSVAGYFNKQRDSIINKNDGIIVYFEPVFFTMSTSEMDQTEVRKLEMLFDKLLVADSYYSKNQYYYINDSLTGLKVTFNRSKQELLVHPDLKKLFESLQYVDVEILDKVAGYPLKADMNEDSLFLVRKKEFNTYFKGNRKDIYAEHLFYLDDEIKFSFKKWKEYSIKDNTLNYSDCELAMCDSKLGLPENVTWLLTFMDPYKVNVHGEDNHYLRNKYRQQSEERIIVDKLSRSYNKVGVAYAIYAEDPDQIELKSFVRDRTGNCNECSLIVRSNVVGSYYGVEPLMRDNDRANEDVWTYYPVDNRFNEFIVSMNTVESSSDGGCASFSSRYLMSTSVALSKPIEFSFPDSDKGWSAIFDCDFSDNEKEYLIDETARFALGAVSSITLPGNCNVAYSSCFKGNNEFPLTPLNTRMYRAPLLYGDFNKNGQLEFVNLFVQSGGIVFTEVYEKDSVTIKKIPVTLAMTRELLALPVIQKILMISTISNIHVLQSVDDMRFYNLNDRIGSVSEDGYPEEVMGYYDGGGYDVVQDVEPPMVSEGNYAGYGGSRSQTYSESGVEVKAEFPGGEKAMNKYIKKNLKYPFRKKFKDDVVVKVTLKITSEGKVEITYASSASNQYPEYFIQEAKRVCSEMPNWSPAELNGKKVNMEKILYIEF